MKRLVRNYKRSDGWLVQKADIVYLSATRDLPELSAFGITPALLDDMKALRNVFYDIPTDEEYSADMVGATQTKNATRVTVEKMIKLIAERGKLKFGERNIRYKMFDNNAISRRDDNEIVRSGRVVSGVGNEYLTDLTSMGLTQDILDELDATVLLFDQQVDIKNKRVRTRDFAVETRVEAGNTLYDAMTYICSVGKLYYQYVSEAKFNDYVIYPSGQSNTKQTIEGKVNPGAVINVSTIGIKPKTELTITNTGDVALDFYFAVDPTENRAEDTVSLPGGAVIDITASSLGFVKGSMERFIVFNPGEGVGWYRVEWE